MESVVSFFDAMLNRVANLGTARDKAAHSSHVFVQPTYQQLLASYRGAWLPRKIVDIPALDACRNWRHWQAEADQISRIEAEEARLGLQRKTMRAKMAARLYGGAAIFMGTRDTDPSQPLNLDAIALGGLSYLTVLTPMEISASEIDHDPASEFYGEPAMWNLVPLKGQPVRVHPTRLAIFHGAELPAGERTGTGWADSVLASVMEAVIHADATTANIASLIFEAKIDVFTIPGLMKNAGDANFEAKLIKRLQLAAVSKGNNGAVVRDAEEGFDQKTMNFANLGDLMDRFFQNVSGAADIPMTRLFGRSPGGLNATGASDLRNYYDRIKAMQALEMQPAMHRLDEALIRSALGERPPEVWFEWASLWQLGEKEKAEIGKLTADTIKTLRDADVFPQEVISEAGGNALTESGALPGLDAALKTYGYSDGDDDGTA